MILKKCARRGLFMQELGVNEVHIWHFDFEKLQPNIDRFFSLLSAEEVKRAHAFKFEKDREAYIISHGAMREVLARYLEIEANVQYQEKGKPYCEGCEFNLSHTKEYAVLAVSRNVAVGIDIEDTSREVNYMALAERFFHPTEVPHNRAEFYRYWTAKEAFVKAVGEGVSFGLDQFSIDAGNSTISWIADEKNMNPQAWQLLFFNVSDGYQGALVYSGMQCSVRHMDFS